MWKALKGFEGRYEVSTSGDIRSLEFTDKLGRKKNGKVLKPTPDKRGYPRYRLSLDGVKTSVRGHRAVAETFIPNPYNKRTVNHKDGDKTYNNVNNLEWATDSENSQHAVDTGLAVYETGDTSRAYKSAVQVYNMDMKFLYELHGNKEMADKGFDFRLVSAVVKGKRNSHKNHIFRREEC